MIKKTWNFNTTTIHVSAQSSCKWIIFLYSCWKNQSYLFFQKLCPFIFFSCWKNQSYLFFQKLCPFIFIFLLEESILFVFPGVVFLYFYICVGGISPICFSRSCVPLFLCSCWKNQSYLLFQECVPFLLRKKMYAGYMRSIDNVHV